MKSAVAAGALGTALGSAQTPADPPSDRKQEFYQLRTYTLRTGPQLALTQRYFHQALIPALNRLGIERVGTFKLDIGPETPTYYVLIPSTSSELLVNLDTRLGSDPEYIAGAAGFRDAPATAPAFVRTERTLLAAFSGWPHLTAAKPVAGKLPNRIFQLRTYESASQIAHAHKIQMFNQAEIAIFQRAGLNPVFFADTLYGTHMPCLTYMLTFTDVAELTVNWAKFAADPDWKELSRTPGNTDPELVSNITNLYLSPLESSQI